MKHLRPARLAVGMVVRVGGRGDCEVVDVRRHMLPKPEGWPAGSPLVRYDIRFRRPDGTTFTEVGCQYSEGFSVVE